MPRCRPDGQGNGNLPRVSRSRCKWSRSDSAETVGAPFLLLVSVPASRDRRRIGRTTMITNRGILGGAPYHGRGTSGLTRTAFDPVIRSVIGIVRQGGAGGGAVGGPRRRRAATAQRRATGRQHHCFPRRPTLLPAAMNSRGC